MMLRLPYPPTTAVAIIAGHSVESWPLGPFAVPHREAHLIGYSPTPQENECQVEKMENKNNKKLKKKEKKTRIRMEKTLQARGRERKKKKKPSLTPLSPLGMAAAHSPNEGRVGDSALCPSFFTSVP